MVKRYPTDLADSGMGDTRTVHPATKGRGRPRTTDRREVSNAIGVCAAQRLPMAHAPKDFPPYKRCMTTAELAFAGVWSGCTIPCAVILREAMTEIESPVLGSSTARR